MAFWCRHDWELADKTTFPNDLEELKRLGFKVKRFSGAGIMDRKIVWWWKCKKCGKLRKDEVVGG